MENHDSHLVTVVGHWVIHLNTFVSEGQLVNSLCLNNNQLSRSELLELTQLNKIFTTNNVTYSRCTGVQSIYDLPFDKTLEYTGTPVSDYAISKRCRDDYQYILAFCKSYKK
jgi:hypothetical protein